MNAATSKFRLALALAAALAVAAPARAAEVPVNTPEDKILSKGFAAYMDGNDKAAQSYFEEVIRINPKNGAAQTGLEKVRLRLKKLESAQKEKALKFADSKMKEGRSLMRTGDVVAAIDSFHAAIDAVPEFKPAKAEMKRVRSQMKATLDKKKFHVSSWAFARGVLAYLDRDWAKAYRIWSERVKVAPDDVAFANATARAENKFKIMMLSEQEDFYRRGARAFYEQGLYGQSKLSWSRVLAMRSDDQEALEGMARSEDAILRASGKGRNSQIQDLLEQGLELYANQNWIRARETFQKIVEIDPEFSTAKEYVSIINRRLQDVAYAPSGSAGVSNWRENRPSNQGTTTVVVPDKLENFSDSRKELESQLKRDPGNIRAQQELDKVVKAQDQESERIYKDGLIAYSQGNRSLAIQQWKQVLVINPDHKKAAAALRKAMAEEERSAPGGSSAP